MLNAATIEMRLCSKTDDDGEDKWSKVDIIVKNGMNLDRYVCVINDAFTFFS